LRLDSDTLASMMRRDAAALGVERFLDEKLVPFIDEVGRGWEEGTVSVRHEHAATEVIETVLREIRTAVGRSASGDPVILATLPGELHGLGLQIVALLLASRGTPVRVIGIDTPVDEITGAAEATNATAVALSITEASVPENTIRAVEALRSSLPPQTKMVVGGKGARHLAPVPEGVRIASSLEDLDLLFPHPS
ncbi:MAG: cobalamin-dependent protein, partial [Thermoanaerobaculia bacterium]|nr:cobalamin-dependent protein [Thermoanaerobaculia bacterium]